MQAKRKGFTIIELMVVVAIIGILAALLIPNLMTAIQKSKLRGTEKDIQAMAVAMTGYITDRGNPPTSNGTIQSSLVTALSPHYIRVLPTRDQWGNRFRVYTGSNVEGVYGLTPVDGHDFLFVSYGKDGSAESWTYNASTAEAGLFELNTLADFDNDLINWNGVFIRGPLNGRSGNHGNHGEGNNGKKD